ncbi:MAG: hypothetical protein ACXAEF_00590 [Candidatus Thorarchaeota archaeon]|jgi:hypothetical protein
MSFDRGPFSFERDLDEVRIFLLDIYKQTGALHYLIPTKVENQKHGPCGPEYSPADDEAIKIWRLSDKENSEIVAVSHRGSAGNYHIEIHPDYKHMEKGLYEAIEILERQIVGEGSSRMYTYTVESDTQRPQVLTELGYTDRGLHEYNYEFPKDALIPENSLPEGYSIRCLRGEEDYSEFIEVFSAVNDHCQEYFSVDRMKFLASAEFYRDDLNLVVADNTGRFVGFCMFRLDPLTQIAEVEAVGTFPNFANMGLEEAMISEGLRRLVKLQPISIYCVEVDKSEPLNQMLESAGYIQSVTMNQWWKYVE